MTILCYSWIIFSSVENRKSHNFAKSDFSDCSDYSDHSDQKIYKPI